MPFCITQLYYSQKYRKNDIMLMKKFKDFMVKLYEVLGTKAFSTIEFQLYRSAKENNDIY